MPLPAKYKPAASTIGAACLSVMMMLVGCREELPPVVTVVARVGENILTGDELAAWEATLHNEAVTNELRDAFVHQWVEKELLYQAARERGLSDDPWVEDRLNELNRELMTSRLLELDAANLQPPTKAQIEEYYRKHQDEFHWIRLHFTIRYWRAGSRAPLDKVRGGLIGERPSPLKPEQAIPIDSGRFEVDDPSAVAPEVWRHFGWMASGQLGYPVSIDQSWWMFKIERRDEPGSVKTLTDVHDVIYARLLEDARLKRKTELLRSIADEYRRSGRLHWVETAVAGQ